MTEFAWVDTGGGHHLLEPLWNDGERLYCKTWGNNGEGVQQELLAVVPAAEYPAPALSQASAERIFDAFYTTKPTGLGMGLSICRSIVEAHGGRLWAEPNQPRGAVFHLTLPIGEDSLENNLEPSALSRAP